MTEETFKKATELKNRIKQLHDFQIKMLMPIILKGQQQLHPADMNFLQSTIAQRRIDLQVEFNKLP